MADKPTSKAEQVAALRQARAERSKGSPELEAAFAVLLPKAESSGGGVVADTQSSPRSVGYKPVAITGFKSDLAGVAPGPSEAKSKRGRPRIGEVREKPWLTAEPPMSERTWYRRQREQRK